MWTIVPDLHADADRLARSLAAVPAGDRLAFLGDLIDAGPEVEAPDAAAVLTRVRALAEAGRAVVLMGNHELTAILCHRRASDGQPLVAHDAENRAKLRSFLDRYGEGSAAALDWTRWFLSLPLWQELGGLRLVHACWSVPHIELIAARRPDGRLHEDDLPEIAAESTKFGRAVKRILTGPHARLPDGASFRDGGGQRQREVRLAWWRSDARTWREAALSVPDPDDLPDEPLPAELVMQLYPADAPPVLVGHYKRPGPPALATANAACLDCPEAPCVYHWAGERRLDPLRLWRV